jgi:prevent-host-death family protein
MSEEIPVTEARAQFSELINRVGFGKERIILTRHGKPLVALVPAETLTDPAEAETADQVVLDLASRPSSSRAKDYTIAAQDRRPPEA